MPIHRTTYTADPLKTRDLVMEDEDRSLDLHIGDFLHAITETGGFVNRKIILCREDGSWVEFTRDGKGN